MEIMEFADKVKKAVKDYFREGLSLSVDKVLTNNGLLLTGLIFKENGSDFGATTYLDGLFEEYQKGLPFGEVILRICRSYENNRPMDNRPMECMELNFFSDYEKVKPKLAIRLLNCDKNRKLLSNVPHRRFLDLAVVYHCILFNDVIDCASVLISNSHMDMWNMDEEKLYNDALENSPRLLPGLITGMGEVVKGFLHDNEYEDISDFLTGMPICPDMYILTNQHKFYGASAILYPGLLEDYANRTGHDIYILPSSIHELILLMDTDSESREHLYSMVHEVNAHNLPADEFLSNNVYYFSRKKGKIDIL